MTVREMTHTNLTFKDGLVQKLKDQKSESMVITFKTPGISDLTANLCLSQIFE